MASEHIAQEVTKVRHKLSQLQDKRIRAAVARDFAESNELQRKIAELLEKLENLRNVTEEKPLK